MLPGGQALCPKDYLNQPATSVRRDDRAVDDEAWMRQFLKTAAVGTLATVHDGQPFINSNLFVYDEANHSIILHTARVGRTRANIEQQDKVCFSIMEMGRILPAEEALEFSVEYAGLTVSGIMSIIDDDVEATEALQLLLDKYAPHLVAGRDYRAPVKEELLRTSVFRVSIVEWPAKKKQVEPGFAGAFFHSTVPMLRCNLEALNISQTWDNLGYPLT